MANAMGMSGGTMGALYDRKKRRDKKRAQERKMSEMKQNTPANQRARMADTAPTNQPQSKMY